MMSSKTCFFSLLLVLAGGLHAASPDNTDKPMTVAGRYATMPQLASESSLLKQGLGSLVLDPLKFANLRVIGKIESIQLTIAGRTLDVMAFDSSGACVLRESVSTENDTDGSNGAITLRREWEGGDEWGNAKGTTITRLTRDADGSLRVDLSTTSSGRIWFFPRRKTTSDSWLKYAPISNKAATNSGHDANPE